MSGKRRKKRSGRGTVFLLVLIIIVGLAILLALGKDYLFDGMKNKVKDIISEQVTEKALENIFRELDDSEAAEKAKEIINTMGEEDKEELKNIVGKYANKETVSEVIEMIGSGTESSLEQAKEYLEETVSEEDIQKLQELYEKYKDLYAGE